MTEVIIVTLNIAFMGLLASFAMAFLRLCKGPTLADRVIALDLIAFITIGFIGAFSIYSNQIAFMDIAITLALVAFLSTIAFARFIMKTQQDKDEAAQAIKHFAADKGDQPSASAATKALDNEEQT